MAKRKQRSAKQIGLKHNQLCPHCGKKVRNLIQLETGYLVEHWWSKEICSTLGEQTKIEQMATARLKKYQFIIKDIANEPA